MVYFFLVLPRDLNNLSLAMAPLLDHGRCPWTFCFSMHVRGCQVVDAWECVMLYPQWKAFAFACFVFQLHFLLLQFFIPNFVIIFGASQVFSFFAT
jgi:hypothetical protein